MKEGELLDVESCLDSRNKDFYFDKIAKYVQVNLIYGGRNDDHWFTIPNMELNRFDIKAGIDFTNVESFTHEMLHVFLLINGVNNSGSTLIYNFINLKKNLGEYCVQWILNILNSISHFRMKPIFESLGYERNKFFAASNPFVQEIQVDEIEQNMRAPSLKGFSDFVKIFFCLKYDYDDRLKEKCADFLERLKTLDPNLFEILANACNLWESQIELNDAPFFNYLFSNLEEYLIKRI